MKQKFFLLFNLLFCLWSNASGQTALTISGTVTECSDATPLTGVMVYLEQNDSIIQTVPSNLTGAFLFKNIKPGTYTLGTHFFYYPQAKQKITITQNYSVSVCLAGNNADSLLANYKFRPLYTIYGFGMSVYSDEVVNKVAIKYGVRYQSLGCNVITPLEKYNEVVRRILAKQNGNNWEKALWAEVSFRNPR